MKSINIRLGSVDKVRAFVNTVNRFTTDFDLMSGRYVIDAKSIMGIFSLDLTKPVKLDIHADEGDPELPLILEALDAYIVK